MLNLGLACSALRGPQDSLHDRVLFDSPEQVVRFVYQNLSAGRYADMSHAFLARADKRPWLDLAARGGRHPWTEDPGAGAEIVGVQPLESGDAEVRVREAWSGGAQERTFRCHRTADGWRILAVEGEPGGIPP